jgi:hypothetical protein
MVAQVNQAGATLWVPCLCLAHLYAVGFILKAIKTLSPDLWRRMKAKTLQFCGGGSFWGAATPRRIAVSAAQRCERALHSGSSSARVDPPVG